MSETRREMLAWLARAGVATVFIPALTLEGCAEAFDDPVKPGTTGYGSDPKLLDPGRPWPLILTDGQRDGLVRLADLILPGDTHGPAPSAINIGAFFDDWLSAPYPDQTADRRIVLPGLATLDDAVGGVFAKVSAGRASQAFDRLANAAPPSSPKQKQDFFLTVRRILLLGYYTSAEGLKDIGYVEPPGRTSFDGPPAEVRAALRI